MTDIDARTVASDGSLDNPEWVKAAAGEIVGGVKGVDWVWDYDSSRSSTAWEIEMCGFDRHCSMSWNSRFRLAMTGGRFLRPRQHLLEDRWGGRLIWNVKPTGLFVSGPGPMTLNL